MGAKCAPVTGSPHSHSTLMTHLAAEDGSDWSVKWNKHGFGARQVLIGYRRRPSIRNEAQSAGGKERARMLDPDCASISVEFQFCL